MKVNTIEKLRRDGAVIINIQNTTLYEPVILIGFTVEISEVFQV